MSFKLLSGRLRVLPDQGSQTTGVIVEDELNGFRGLTKTPNPEPWPAPPPTPEYYNHIVFVKEMAAEVEIDGVTYLVMSSDAVLGTLD